jgi:hypothetical protein
LSPAPRRAVAAESDVPVGRQLVCLVEDGAMADQEPGDPWAALSAWSEALEELWATQAVPSPGGWSDASEPPQGVVAALGRMPWWVRVWYHTPFLDRRASAWMWPRGGFDVLPRSVQLPAEPEWPLPSVILPLSGEDVHLGEMRKGDPEPGLVCGVGGTRVTNHRRRPFGQRWASHVYGVRPTPEPVSVRVCRSSRWRSLRRWHEAEVVYGAEGVWAAETLGRWDVVEVAHAGQTHRTGISPGRRWEFAFPRPKQRSGEEGVIFGPGEASEK